MNDIECNYVVENLSAFIDKELPKDISKRINKHLCGCLSCRRTFSQLLKMQHVLKNYFEGTTDASFKSDIKKIMETVKSSH